MISIIVPTYNEEKNVEKCLRALHNQTISREKYEIIIVDGHSNDKTRMIARRFADRVIMQKTRWIAGARNDGAHAAKYDIIACTDADCIVNEHWLEEIIKSLGKENTISVFGPMIPPESTGAFYKWLFFFTNKCISNLNKININFIFTSSFAFKKQPFLEIGGFSDISILEDFEISFRLRKKGEIIFNKNMNVIYDLRRFKKYGISGIIRIVHFNMIKILLGFKPAENIRYSKQNYDDT